VAVADLVLSSFDGKGKVVTSKVAETLKDLESKSKQFRYQDAASQVRHFPVFLFWPIFGEIQ
jgi:hypothetical protein